MDILLGGIESLHPTALTATPTDVVYALLTS